MDVRKDPRDPEVQDKQRIYHRALETIPNLVIYRGRFLEKRVAGRLVDPLPGERVRRTVMTYEEKGTDVNIASRMLVDGFEARYEHAALISNDGDLKMPVEIIRAQLDLPVTVINPVLKRRGRKRSSTLSPKPLPPNAAFVQLRAKHVEECQFPWEMRSAQGTRLLKPKAW